MSGAMPAARVGDPIAHSNAGLGMALGVLAGVAAGAVLVGATIATGGAALAVVAAVGGAAALTSFGGLKGMAIGGASMGPPTGALLIGSVNVLINARPATMTALSSALCAKDPGPILLATGASTVLINACMAGREGETMACSAKVVAACSPNVIIGGPSAQDPRVTITPEVPPWAVTSLQVLGTVGAVMALPYSLATLGIGGTIATGLMGAGGSFIGAKAMRALAESMGMSEAGVLTMEAFGELGGGIIGGSAAARRFVVKPSSKPSWQRKLEEGNEFNRSQAPRYPHNEVMLNRPTGAKGYPRIDSYDPVKGEIVSRKNTQLASVKEATAKSYLDELSTRYPSGSTIADVPSQRVGSGHGNAGLGGTRMTGTQILEVPPQKSPVPQSVLDHAQDLGITIRDTNGRIYP